MINAHKTDRNPNTTLKIVIKSQVNRAKEEERNQENDKNDQKTMNQMVISTYLSIIT